MTGEGPKRTFQGDGNVLHLDHGGGYVTVHVYQNSRKHALRVNFTKWKSHLKYRTKQRNRFLKASLLPYSSPPDTVQKPVLGKGRAVSPLLWVFIFESGLGLSGALHKVKGSDRSVRSGIIVNWHQTPLGGRCPDSGPCPHEVNVFFGCGASLLCGLLLLAPGLRGRTPG